MSCISGVESLCLIKCAITEVLCNSTNSKPCKILSATKNPFVVLHLYEPIFLGVWNRCKQPWKNLFLHNCFFGCALFSPDEGRASKTSKANQHMREESMCWECLLSQQVCILLFVLTELNIYWKSQNLNWVVLSYRNHLVVLRPWEEHVLSGTRRLKSSMKSGIKAVTQTWLPLTIKPGNISEELRYRGIIIWKYIYNVSTNWNSTPHVQKESY